MLISWLSRSILLSLCWVNLSYAQDISKSLLIRDVSVVDKLFPFHKTIKDIGLTSEELIDDWLNEWKLSSLNNYSLIPRDTKVIKDLWPKKSNGEIDLHKSPFRLMAVVNRMDLLSKEVEYGEFRLVYGLFDPSSMDPKEMTIIFEFKIPAVTKDSYNYWRDEFLSLSYLSFGEHFNNKLSSMYKKVVNSKNLNQVRTNDFFLDFIWEMREFKLQNDKLKQVVTAQNPDLTHNLSVPFYTWIKENEKKIMNLSYRIPQKFLAPSSLLETELFQWDFGFKHDEKIRKHLSINTCNGCHGGETQTEFTHIKIRREGVSSYISHFLQKELKMRKENIFNSSQRPRQLPREVTRVH